MSVSFFSKFVGFLSYARKFLTVNLLNELSLGQIRHKCKKKFTKIRRFSVCLIESESDSLKALDGKSLDCFWVRQK